jgi:hypothetical protein
LLIDKEVLFQIKSSITDPEALFLYTQADWSSDLYAFFLPCPLSTVVTERAKLWKKRKG